MPDRFLLTAPASGCGKTFLTCGILRALQMQGKNPVSFKCGPDYIDPMFHSRVLGTKSRNLDTFFLQDEAARRLLAENGAGSDIAVLEGAMGYYDGLGGTSDRASAYDAARATDTPAVLIVDARGASLSLIPLIRGFLEYRPDSRIRGVIFNRMSPMLYPRMKGLLQDELQISAAGYVPNLKDCSLESRHLGLVMPEEIPNLQKKIDRLAETLLETLDWEALYGIASQAGDIQQPAGDRESRIISTTNMTAHLQSADSGMQADRGNGEDIFLPRPAGNGMSAGREKGKDTSLPQPAEDGRLSLGRGQADHSLFQTAGEKGEKKKRTIETSARIGIARDEAFCFFYEDNFDFLREMGAELVWFSPLRDAALPEELDGLLLYGGYPELHAEELGRNRSMRESVREAITGGLPCMAECGGFLYLHEQLEDMDGKAHPMAGVIPGTARKTDRLGPFGYVTLTEGKVFGQEVGPIPSHEYHYFASDNPGGDFLAEKPQGKRSWRCIHSTDTLFAGFPHIYFPANPKTAEAFMAACLKYAGQKKNRRMGEGFRQQRQKP